MKKYIRLIHITCGWNAAHHFGNVSYSVFAQDNALYTKLILTSLKYTVSGQDSARPDNQGEENTQTHHALTAPKAANRI